jgi:arsenate reductase (thioredoxin)
MSSTFSSEHQYAVPTPHPVSGEELRSAFRDAFLILDRRVNLFLSLSLASLDRLAINREIDEIGRH